MGSENEITQIVSRYTRAADQRDGEAMAKLYTPDAVVEIHYHRGPDGTELLGTLSGQARWNLAATRNYLQRFPRSPG
jgi:ketosteroid isomerase-like protein